MYSGNVLCGMHRHSRSTYFFQKNRMKEEIMNQTNIKIGQLRDRMKELGIDAYLVPTADFHESEYVGEFFKMAVTS